MKCTCDSFTIKYDGCQCGFGADTIDRFRDNFLLFCSRFLSIGNWYDLHSDGMAGYDFKIESLLNYHIQFSKFVETNRYAIAKRFKYSGLISTSLAYLIWKAVFTKNFIASVVCPVGTVLDLKNQLIGMLSELKNKYPKIVSVNRDFRAVFNNGSEIGLYLENQSTTGAPPADMFLFLDCSNYSSPEYAWRHFSALTKSNLSKYLIVFRPYEMGGDHWVKDLYINAGNNSFKKFDVDSTSHPFYRNKEWVLDLKKQLRSNEWKTQVIGEFI